MGIDLDAVRAWVERTCAAQGVGVFVSDAGVVARVGNLLGGGVPAQPPEGGERGSGA